MFKKIRDWWTDNSNVTVLDDKDRRRRQLIEDIADLQRADQSNGLSCRASRFAYLRVEYPHSGNRACIELSTDEYDLLVDWVQDILALRRTKLEELLHKKTHELTQLLCDEAKAKEEELPDEGT